MFGTITLPLSRRAFLARSAAVVVAGAALPILAACGVASTATSASSSVAATSTIAPAPASTTAKNSAASQHTASLTAPPTSQAATGRKAQGRIIWLVPQDPLLVKYATDAIVPAFEKANPATTVQVIAPGSTDYGVKLIALVGGGTIPEVFCTWGASGFYLLLHKKLLTNLTPYLQKSKIDPSFILPSYRTEFSTQGDLYGIAWNSNPNFIVYNKTLFDKYNVPLPPSDWNDKTWTTDKILQAAQALTHNTGNPATSTYGLTMGAGTCGTLGWLWNADPFNNTGGPEASTVYQGKPLTAVYPDRQPMVDAMTWLADLTLKYHVSPNPSDAKALSSQGNPIFSGRVGMAEEAGGWLDRQAAVVKPNFDWGIAPFPYGPGGKNTSQREDTAWYLGNGSKNPDGGFDLIMFASRGTGADDLITIAKDNPPVSDTSYFTKWATSVLTIPGMSMNGQSFQAVFEGGIMKGFPDPESLIDQGGELTNAFTQLMGPVWIGERSPLGAWCIFFGAG